MQAAAHGQKLEDAIARLIEIGLAHAPGTEPPACPPKPVRLEQHEPSSIIDIEAAIATGRD